MNEYIKINPIGGDGIPLAEKGAPNGVATLDGSGKVPVSQLPNAGVSFPLLASDADPSSPSYSFSSSSTAGMTLSSGNLNLGLDPLNGIIIDPTQVSFLGLPVSINNDGSGAYPSLSLGDGSFAFSQPGTALQVIFNQTLPVAEFDGSDTAGVTRFLLWDVDSGMLQRVKVTANNAVLGVTGRVLYIDNI